jgi:hypothetical protein
MKKQLFRSLWLLSFAILSVLFVACDKEDDDPIVLVPNLNGLYVFGTNTVATAPGNAASKVNLAVLDPGKGLQVPSIAGVFGKFIHIGANSTIQLAYKQDATEKVYGADNGGSIDSAIVTGGKINDVVIHGTLKDGGAPIKVAKAGLYYLYADVNTETFVLMEVKANMIGDATELDWSAGTLLPLKSSDTTSTVFEATGVPLVGASGYRYRFNDGWHVHEDATTVTLSSMGVLSYGAAWDSGINDIGFFLDNAPHKETGIFTLTLTYDAKTGVWSEVKTKIGELLVDYSDARYGWHGNAYYVEGTTPGAWEQVIHHSKTPTKVGNLYNWEWNLELIQGKSFVLREDGGPAWITYGGAAKLGSAFENGQIIKEATADNYYVEVGGNYKITFTINAEDEGRILTIVPQ